MSVSQVLWHGSDDEREALLKAVAANCGCTYGEAGEVSNRCAAHQMMLTDQRAMDGLLFMRRKAACLEHEEQTDDRPW